MVQHIQSIMYHASLILSRFNSISVTVVETDYIDEEDEAQLDFEFQEIQANRLSLEHAVRIDIYTNFTKVCNKWLLHYSIISQ